MSLRNHQEPFSLPEFVVASIAMAVVAVIAFRGIWGSRDPNPSAATLSQLRPASATGRSLQVSPWRLDNADAMRMRPNRTPDIMTVRKAESSPIPNPGGTNGFPASTFFAEAAPATIVEMRLPDIGGPPPPLIWPPDLFRMKNAISDQPIKGTIPTHIERRESPLNLK